MAYSATRKAWYQHNKERWVEYQRTFRNKHPARAAEIQRHSQRLHKYGLTKLQFEEMLAMQEGACAACGSLPPGTTHGWSVDHSHSTGKVRGLLCMTCNLSLGVIENLPRMAFLTAYLEKHL